MACAFFCAAISKHDREQTVKADRGRYRSASGLRTPHPSHLNVTVHSLVCMTPPATTLYMLSPKLILCTFCHGRTIAHPSLRYPDVIGNIPGEGWLVTWVLYDRITDIFLIRRSCLLVLSDVHHLYLWLRVNVIEIPICYIRHYSK
jgi:hypothetical protein